MKRGGNPSPLREQQLSLFNETPIDASMNKSIGNSRVTGLLALPRYREWVVLTTQLIIRIAMIDRSVKQFPSNHLPEIVVFVVCVHSSFLRSDAE